MKPIKLISAAVLSGTIGLSSPLSRYESTISPRKIHPDDLHNVWKGLNFTVAYNECEDWQYDIIAEAIRMADGMTHKLPEDLDENGYAMEKYFVNWDTWKKNTDDTGDLHYETTFLRLTQHMRTARDFPKAGKRRYTEKQRLRYTCKPEPNQPCRPSATAHTYDARLTEDNVWMVNFCPNFWTNKKLKYVNEYIPSPRLRSDVGKLDSYERVILHEWMHVGLFGYGFQIRDLNDTVRPDEGEDEKAPIYGSIRCDMYAHKYMGGDDPKANLMVAGNADNFSWFWTYYWFEHLWNWNNADENEDLNGEVSGACVPTMLVDAKDYKVPEGMPENCHQVEGQEKEPGVPLWICDYIGEDYDGWKANLDQPMDAEGDNCELSKECKKSVEVGAVDPNCVCKCNGELTPLRDDRCQGFAGALPGNAPP